jgi:WD40 repeat protein
VLKQWLINDTCRLVGIIGVGGIGKTMLAKKLARELIDQFEYIFWRSLVNSPPLVEVLHDCILLLSDYQEAYLPEHPDQAYRLLLRYLQQHRCLIILDNVETILRSGERAGEYRDEYQDYGQIIRMVGETDHQSCLVVTSREKPKDLLSLEIAVKTRQGVRAYPLQGVFPDEVREVVEEMGIAATASELTTLIKRCSGNPKILEIVIPNIHQYYQGDVSAFLEAETIAFGEVKDIMQQQFGRLSLYEQEIMYWLAIEREPISLNILRERIIDLEHRLALIDTLNSLTARSLIEHVDGAFFLQNAIMEYVTTSLVSQMAQEIVSGQITLFSRHSLVIAQTKDYVRESQKRLVLIPLANKLLTALGTQAIESQFRTILVQLRQLPSHKRTYAVGNMLNLLLYLQYDLNGWDFSGLAVWQAYLRNVDLRRVNLANTDLVGSVFTEAFNSVMSVACSPDGTLLATLGRNGEIFIWRLTDGKILSRYMERTASRWTRSITFSPEGRWLACASGDLNIRLLDVATGKCVKILSGHSNTVRAIAFHPDGNLLASGADDQTVRLWNVHTDDCIKVLRGHSAEVRAVTFHPDGQLLASSSADTTICLWDATTHACIRVLSGHSDQVSSAVFYSDDILISSSYDHTIRLWNIQIGGCLKVLQAHKDWVTCLALDHTQHLLASGSADSTAVIWSISQLQSGYLRRLTDHTSTVWSIAFSPDSHTFVSCSDDQTVRLWDTDHWHCHRQLAGYTNPVLSVVFSPDGTFLASGHGDRTVQVWNVKSGQCYRSCRGHTGRVNWVDFAFDGRMIVSGGEDRSIYFWMVDSGEIRHMISLNHGWLYSIFALSPDGKSFFSESADDSCIVELIIPTGQIGRTIKLHALTIESIAFSSNGAWFASGSDDQTVKIWDPQVETCYHTLQGHTHWVWCIAFSPDSQMLASGSEDRTVRIWDVQSGVCLAVLEGHQERIWSVAFSADNQLLASGSDDHTVRIWNVHTGKSVHVLEHPDQVREAEAVNCPTLRKLGRQQAHE